MGQPRSDQPLIAQEQNTPPPPEGSDRKQSSMPQATRQQKMQTCEFGAKDQKLTGGARKTFMRKCLASDDAPGRKASAKPKAQQ
ncbi:MAG: PsiF family protein [Xanthobacteraceae bacterium]